MPKPTKTEARQIQLDHIAEVLDVELAAAAERMHSAQRSLVRANDRYAQLVEARSSLRLLAES